MSITPEQISGNDKGSKVWDTPMYTNTEIEGNSLDNVRGHQGNKLENRRPNRW